MSRSRPGSAQARYSGDRPVAAPRRSSVSEREAFMTDCKAAYLAVFDDLETDIASRKELCAVLQQAGRSPTNRMLEKYWKSNTDSLSFEDFCEICRSEPETTEDDLMKAFRKIDVNGDGFISNAELKKMLTTRGDKLSTREVQEIIDEVDENGDGKLNYKEFARMILKTKEECRTLAHKNLERKQTTAPANSSKTSQPSPKPSRKEPAKSLSTVREWSKAAISRQLNLTKPKTLREWKMCKSKGSFFFNSESKIVSHQYSLRVTQDTNVWITVEPLCIRPGGDLNSSCDVNGAPMDVMVFVLNTDDTLVAFSEQRDSKGKYALSCELTKGVYKVLTSTTGCRFKKRPSEARQATELVRRKDGKVTLTKAFKDALFDIFEMCDLTSNGLWSRDEFRLYNLLTSEQELDDAEWQVVEDKIEMSDGQITKQGFLNLIQMEAEDLDPDENDDDLWVTLESFGFGKSLIMDEVSPFLLEVYAEKCSPVLKVTKLEPGGKMLTNAIVQMVMRKGEESRVKGSKDLFLHSYVTDFRISLVIENRASARQSVMVDCRKSQNATSSQPSGLQCTVDISPKATVVAHHLMPIKESLAWSVSCAESVK